MKKNNLKIIEKNLIVNNVPLENISVNGGKIVIELDDKSEKRYRLTFSPIQAQKIITIDCADSNSFFSEECLICGKYQRFLLEVVESEWIKQLKSDLKKNDENANFMDKSRHFVLDLRDIIVEIVAWNYEIEEVRG